MQLNLMVLGSEYFSTSVADPQSSANMVLTHWDRVMHICISNLTIIGSDNGLVPGWHQAIILTSAGVLLIQTSGTNFSEILSKIHTFNSRKCIWKCCLQNGGYFVQEEM